ncbi:MAG: hypothetical protein ACRYFX_02565 [Janthinobacterium lividum]
MTIGGVVLGAIVLVAAGKLLRTASRTGKVIGVVRLLVGVGLWDVALAGYSEFIQGMRR